MITTTLQNANNINDNNNKNKEKYLVRENKSLACLFFFF